MSAEPVWQRLEQQLRQLYAMPCNLIEIRRHDPAATVDSAVRKTLGEVRSGLLGPPTEERFQGPKVFLRVAGARNRVYGGQWWFDADLHDRLETAYARLYFDSADRAATVRDMLRELLAVSENWNAMTEVWALELQPGETLVGYSGIGSPQLLHQGGALGGAGNRLLVGGARQIFIPVKNPLAVRKVRDLA